MKKPLLKLFLALTAFIFGFSKMVAAQYGVVVNHFKLQGMVVSSECGFGIPGVIVKAVSADGQNPDTVRVVTSESGSFSLELLSNWEIKNRSFIILTEDPDGEKNKGDYSAALTEFIVKDEELKVIDPNGWARHYESTVGLLIPLKHRGKKPCD